jgi:hypothetical protein
MARFAVKPSIAVLGSLSGAVVIGGMRLLLPSGWLLPLLVGYAGIVLVAYLIGAFTVGRVAGEFCRGLIIGTNAAMNLVLAAALFPGLIGHQAGIILAIVLGVISFASTFAFLSRSAVYQGVLGYCNWLLPLSWPIVGLGFAFFILSGLGAATLGLLQVVFFKVSRVVFDWRTGTLFTRGGWISNLNPIDTAFNMGNFAFVDSKFDEMPIDHEAGHTLNLAAFGTLFHLVGAFDENVLNGEDAFSERIAESHVANSTRPLLEMWA